MTAVMRAFSYTAIGPVWFAGATILNILNGRGIRFVDQQTVFLQALYCPLVAWLIGRILKSVFQRRRPVQILENFTALFPAPQNDSFPSLHAASTVALFVALLVTHHDMAAAVGVWAFFVTFSRLYLGVHFPTDLLGGVTLGVVAGVLIGKIMSGIPLFYKIFY